MRGLRYNQYCRGNPEMMLNTFQNKRSGPGGSARRLHHLGGVFTSKDGLPTQPRWRGRNRFDTRGKGKVCIRDGTVVIGLFYICKRQLRRSE